MYDLPMTTAATTARNKPRVPSRLPMFYYFILFCSLFLSHPLYLSYFILLLLYFLKFLSFLSPLFISTSLVLLLLRLTFSPPGLIINNDNSISAKSKLLALFRGFIEKLRPKGADDEKEEFVHQASKECEVYKILFEVAPEVKVQGIGLEVEPEPESELAPVDKFLICADDDGVRDDIKSENLEEERPKTSTVEKDSGAGGQKNYKTLGRLFVEDLEQELEDAAFNEEEEKVKHKKLGEAKEGSDALCHKEVVAANKLKERDDDIGFPKITGQLYGFTKLGGSVRVTGSDYKFGYKEVMGFDNYKLGGSMRSEKEWKRTLACKLYEERNNGSDNDDEEEGMDLLWETYENDSTTTEMQAKSKTEKSKSDYDDDDEEEAEEKLCCLQVLKFSAGKMGRNPNLVKISKALTFRGMGLGLGLGWTKHKHGTK